MTTPGHPPLPPSRCYWHRDEDGNTTLIPGCWPRVHDPDADCLCGEWSEDTARQTIRSMKATIYRERELVQTLRRALRAAGIPDPTAMHEAWRDLKAYSARMRRREMHNVITQAGLDQ